MIHWILWGHLQGLLYIFFLKGMETGGLEMMGGGDDKETKDCGRWWGRGWERERKENGRANSRLVHMFSITLLCLFYLFFQDACQHPAQFVSSTSSSSSISSTSSEESSFDSSLIPASSSSLSSTSWSSHSTLPHHPFSIVMISCLNVLPFSLTTPLFNRRIWW